MSLPTTPTFAELGLADPLVAALAAMGLTHPTPVQVEAIPMVRTGEDLMVQSRTGTGKTLAYALPLLERLDPQRPQVQALVIAPTRELANQVGAVLARVGRALGARVATLTGGVPYGEQLRALRGATVVVGTPGRLVDHMDRGSLSLVDCLMVVLDEADEILDMGFQEDLEKLLAAAGGQKQTLLFSATLADEIEALGRRYMRSPRRLGLGGGMEASTTLTHLRYEVTRDSRYEALVNLIQTQQPELAILFCHTKAATEELAKRLGVEGFKVGYLNGDLPQALRTKTLESFRTHQIALLVATDVAARGIDVRGISHVINFDFPRGAETYIHRSGRAGRAGRPGVVLNLVTPSDRAKVSAVAREARLTMELKSVPQAAEVRTQLRRKFFEELANRTEATALDDLREFATELLAHLEPVALVAALLQDVQSASGQLAAGYDVAVPTPFTEKRKAVASKGPHGSEPQPATGTPKRAARQRPPKPHEAGMRRLRLGVGKAERIQPGYLVRVICDRAGITNSAIGAISLYTHHTVVDVRSDVADKVVQTLNASADERGRKWKATFETP